MKTNSDLEKFKFVLEYRIRELRKLIEPKDREIIHLKQQNADVCGKNIIVDLKPASCQS